MSENPKTIVEQAYDHIADFYLTWAEGHKTPREGYTEKVLAAVPTKSSPHILELGCGPGVPITRMLLDRGARVTANDISTKQIALAKARCPEATYAPGDMTALAFEDGEFDGATCFYAIFHLPRAEQKGMLEKVFGWLKPGAVFVFNFPKGQDHEEIHGEMMGHGMFWSSFDVEETKEMVQDVGFEIVEAEVLEAGDGKLKEDDLDYGVTFVWLAVRKP
ncbi:Sphingolipid C9-methyltransferase 2 [Elsinoe australis]|uniref:Sphingolipid C9-methyltransferase 2 n=1 Tax=Elsinoe australis TaxID=40998 RepID=A0A2P8AI82_9PEZI|nr:Sphingolipid C9-methyltransferase 2 [Elsinoe australis]